MIFPIIGQALIEGTVLFWSDVRWVASPDGFRLVELLVGDLPLLDLFSFLRFVFVFLILFIVDLLNLGFLFLLFFFLFLIIFYLLQRRLSTGTYDAYT